MSGAPACPMPLAARQSCCSPKLLFAGGQRPSWIIEQLRPSARDARPLAEGLALDRGRWVQADVQVGTHRHGSPAHRHQPLETVRADPVRRSQGRQDRSINADSVHEPKSFDWRLAARWRRSLLAGSGRSGSSRRRRRAVLRLRMASKATADPVAGVKVEKGKD